MTGDGAFSPLPKDANDTLGEDGYFVDPLWRITVALTPLEQDLLASWWVRRLSLVAHAGAAAMATTQSYSRLEHSLGLLALAAHFSPDDLVCRAAALVHDVGHLPLSHTFEGLGGLHHHELGATRLEDLRDVFSRHDMDVAEIVAIVQGRKPTMLTAETGLLKLDHLDSFVRSGRAHGRTREAPSLTLDRLRLIDGAVDTDERTAGYIADLVAGEARSQCSEVNATATGLIRYLATLVLANMSPVDQRLVAEMTDDEFWSLLLTEPRTRDQARAFRRNPSTWRAVRQGRDTVTAEPEVGTDRIHFRIDRLYLGVPLVDGARPASVPGSLLDLPAPPLHYLLERQTPVES
jgi:hypothetical protein